MQTNLNGTIDSNGVDVSPKLIGANIIQLQCYNHHPKARKPVNDNGILNKWGYNLQKQVRGPKKLYDTDMSLNYTVSLIGTGQDSSSKV